jgi:hypothetical protein
MRFIFKTLSASLFLFFMAACGVEGENSQVSSAPAPAPNLKASALNFECGDGVVVIETKNVGDAKAGSSFFRVDQSNAGSSAVAVKALKPGESERRAIVVKYKDGKLEATITTDANRTVAESNEHDNILRLVCK